MKTRRSLLVRMLEVVSPVVVLAAGLAVLLLAFWLKPEPPKKEEEQLIAGVETMPIESYDGTISIDVDGTVVPFREISLTAEVEGRIQFKSELCRAGRFVPAGTLLMEINPIDYKLEVEKLAKEVRRAEISLRQTEIETRNTDELVKLAREDLKLQSREVSRLAGLLDDRVVTDSELDVARRSEVATRNTLQLLLNQENLLAAQRDGAQAALELAATQLEKAQIDLQRTKIVAPIDGMIVSDLMEQDSYVQRGTLLVELEDTSAVEVKCNLRMEQLYWLWEQESGTGSALDAAISARGYELPKARADVTYHLAGQDFVWRGQLWRFDGIGLDPKTRTVPCRVLVPDPLNVRRAGDDNAFSALWRAGRSALVSVIRMGRHTVEARHDVTVGLLTAVGYSVPSLAPSLSREAVLTRIKLNSRAALGAVLNRHFMLGNFGLRRRGGPPALVRGMFVNVSLKLDPRARLGSVPMLALQPGNMIWRVTDGKLQIDKARVARLLPNKVLLHLKGAPYRIGDAVVTSPLASPRDGMPVEILRNEPTVAVGAGRQTLGRNTAL